MRVPLLGEDPDIRFHENARDLAVQYRLDDRGAECDGLHMGKPVGDLWIDDRAVRFENGPDTLEQVDRILS